MKKLKQKIASQAGASITFALLLFLVCAVVSTIVLAAGTAASGRISGSVDNDRRYYSVTSACEMLMDLFDGVTVTIQETKTGTGTDAATSLATPVVTKDGETITDTSNYNLLILAAKLYTGTTESDDPTSFPENLEIAIDSTKNASVKATFVSEADQPDSARITLAVSSCDEDSDEDEDADAETDTETDSLEDVYTLYLIFDADIKETVDSKTKDTSSGGSTVVQTTKTKITWTLTSMNSLTTY